MGTNISIHWSEFGVFEGCMGSVKSRNRKSEASEPISGNIKIHIWFGT